MLPIFHLLIPVLILLLLRTEKRLFLLAPIALLPDLDYFTLIYHRAFFHNIFFGIALVSLIYFRLGRKPALVSALFFFSHLALDFDSVGVGLLFPLTSMAYGFDSGLFAVPISGIQFNTISLSVLSPLDFSLVFLSLSAIFLFALSDDLGKRLKFSWI